MAQGNITLQAGLLREMQAAARAAGKTVDDVANEVLAQYISRREATRELRDLSRWGQQHSKARGDRPSGVLRAIAESRLDRRRR